MYLNPFLPSKKAIGLLTAHDISITIGFCICWGFRQYDNMVEMIWGQACDCIYRMKNRNLQANKAHWEVFIMSKAHKEQSDYEYVYDCSDGQEQSDWQR